MKPRLAIITSHPIQYNAPVFQLLAKRNKIEIKVFYTWGKEGLQAKFDPGFGKKIEWDIPLLEGYPYLALRNVSKNPGSHHFKGIDNPEILSLIKEFQPDHILLFGWSFKSHLKVIRYFSGKIPLIFRGDSTLLNEVSLPLFKKTARRLFLTWLYRKIDKALYVGTHNKAYYKMHGIKEQNLIYAPHAIDNNRFGSEQTNYETDALDWKKQLAIPSSHIVVLYAGKIEPVKNIDLLVKLAVRLQDESVSFIIAGNGPEEPRIKQLCKDLPHVKFLDFQNQGRMPVLYRTADIFMLPSVSETWGLALNEAMASGLAVMASEKCGGAIDMIEDQENGVIFSLEDVDKPSRFIRNMIQQPELLKNAKQKSKIRISDFNFERIVRSIEAICLTGVTK